MSEDSKKNITEEEVDFLKLLKGIGNSLNKFGKYLTRGFLTCIVFLIRKWLPLVISVILGICLSFILKTVSPSFYSSNLVLKNNLESYQRNDIKTIKDFLLANSGVNYEMINYINRLHEYCKENNYEALKSSLSIDDNAVGNLIDIGAFWIIDKNNDGNPDYVDYDNRHNIYDTINVRMLDRLNIRVKSKSHKDLTILRDELILFIEKDSLFQNKNRLRQKQNIELLSRMNYDIKQLDSLQKVKYFEETRNKQPQTGSQMVFLQEQKTQLVYPDIYNLYSKKQELESEIELYKGIVTVLSDFSLPIKRINGALYYGKKVIPLLFSITLLILILIANKQKLIETYKKY